MFDVPSEVLYTKEHEWIRISGSQGIVGITDYAQKSLGDIVFVEFPEVDEDIDAGDEFGTIESVKAVSSLFMPVSGSIADVNAEVHQRPELVNEDCYNDGWLVRITLSNPQETEGLMTPEEYEQFLEVEE